MLKYLSQTRSFFQENYVWIVTVTGSVAIFLTLFFSVSFFNDNFYDTNRSIKKENQDVNLRNAVFVNGAKIKSLEKDLKNLEKNENPLFIDTAAHNRLSAIDRKNAEYFKRKKQSR